MVRLIALDLDRTLLNDKKKIEAETLDSLRQAISRGIFVVLATGRTLPSTKIYAEQIGPEVICMSYNGSVLFTREQSRVQMGQLSEYVLDVLIDYCSNNNYYLQLYDGDTIIVEKICEELLKDPDSETTPYFAIGDLHSRKQIVASKAMIMEKVEMVPIITEELQEMLQGQAIITCSHEYLIEILPEGMGKKNALCRLANSLGISREEVMACGDNLNDLEMIEWAGLGVAVANSLAVVQKCANYVCEKKNSLGVNEALKKWVLI